MNKINLRKHVTEAKRLAKGENVSIESHGLKIKADLLWSESNNADIEAFSVVGFVKNTQLDKLYNVTPKAEKGYDIFTHFSSAFEDSIMRVIEDSKEYLAFDKRIKQVCIEADLLDKEKGEYWWEENILPRLG